MLVSFPSMPVYDEGCVLCETHPTEATEAGEVMDLPSKSELSEPQQIKLMPQFLKEWLVFLSPE